MPPEHAYKHRVLLISKGPYFSYHSRSRCSRKPWEGLYFPYCPWGWSAKTMKRSLFPLFPLFWWPMSIHPVKTWTTKIEEIGTLSVFLLVKCQKHERVLISPISPKGEVPKPWEGPYFPYFPYLGAPILVVHASSSCQDMGHQNREIGTLSWFWHFTLRGNRGNRDPLSVFPWWSAKTMKVFPILVAHVLTRWQGMDHQNRGNRGNRDPLMVLALHP